MTTVVRAPARRRLRRREAADMAARPARRASARVRFALGWLPLLGAMAALVPAHHAWAAQAALLVLLLVVPGRLLLRAFGVPAESIMSMPAYVPLASLVVLMAAGLGVDLLGPQLGVTTPLRAWPLLVGVEVACLVLLIAGLVPRPERVSVPWRSFNPRVWRAWPLALPLAAGAGALRLTNHSGGTVAIIAAAAVGATLLFCGVLASRLSRSQLNLALYGCGLALAWSFSLRGHYVYGWDISSEYRTFTSIYAAGIWHTPHQHDAYGAMLSLTVLPSLLHAISGISALAVFKAVFPVLVALLPLAVFGIADRFVSRRYAFIAAAFIVVQSYFFQEMPEIARQEIGILLFAGLAAAVLDDRMPKRAQVPLAIALGAGLVVSHYTTTYLAGAFFGSAVLLQLVVSRFRRLPLSAPAVLAAFVVAFGGGILWNAKITHSSSNVTGFVQDIRHKGFNLLPNAQAGQGILNSYISGNISTHIPARRYEQLVAAEFARQKQFVRPLRASREPRYALQDAQAKTYPVRWQAGLTAAQKGQLVAAQLFNLLAVAGALALIVRRRGSPGLRLVGVLGASTLLGLAFLRLSGTAAASYNQERVFLQAMVPLSVCIAWLLERFAGGRARRIVIPLLTAGALALIFAATSGLRGATLGGGGATNLANSGEDYERFVVTPPEFAAARWLNKVPPKGIIYADTYGQIRVLAATGRSRGVLLDPTPRTIDQHAWVYGSRSNVVLGHARGTVSSNRYSVFRWPARYLDENYDLVYSNGTSEVYHR